jgi:hypothetical protein
MRSRETALLRKLQSTILPEAGRNQPASFGILTPVQRMDGRRHPALSLSTTGVFPVERQGSHQQLHTSIYARRWGVNSLYATVCRPGRWVYLPRRPEDLAIAEEIQYIDPSLRSE